MRNLCTPDNLQWSCAIQHIVLACRMGLSCYSNCQFYFVTALHNGCVVQSVLQGAVCGLRDSITQIHLRYTEFIHKCSTGFLFVSSNCSYSSIENDSTFAPFPLTLLDCHQSHASVSHSVCSCCYDYAMYGIGCTLVILPIVHSTFELQPSWKLFKPFGWEYISKINKNTK